MKPQQAILVLCDDAADLAKIAAGIRGMVGVKRTQTGAFRQEHYDRHHVAMFFPTIPRGQNPPGIVVDPPDRL